MLAGHLHCAQVTTCGSLHIRLNTAELLVRQCVVRQFMVVEHQHL
jgi:hypothetical protein